MFYFFADLTVLCSLFLACLMADPNLVSNEVRPIGGEFLDLVYFSCFIAELCLIGACSVMNCVPELMQCLSLQKSIVSNSFALISI